MAVSDNDFGVEIAQLRDLDHTHLRARWRSVFRRQAPDHLPRHLLYRMLAYRLQAERLGDIDRDIGRFLEQIASRTLKAEAFPAAGQRSHRLGLQPGTILVREWNGESQHVTVLDEGFAWSGRTYRSLTEIAYAITGTRWSGPRFFGLRNRGEKSA